MEKQMKWGLATLMLLLGIAAVFLFIDQNAELQQLEKETAESDKLRQEHNKPQEPPVAVEELPPVVPPNEHPSGPHQHEDDTAHNPLVSQVSQTYTGPLTYHEELLKTNPVKALRLQAEERGHWSAEWIPPFPPDDQEAATYARIRYIFIYYEGIGDTESSEYKAANRMYLPVHRAIRAYPSGARRADLMKLTWPNLDEPIAVYDVRGNRQQPSDFFPIWRSEAEKRAAYGGFYEVFEAVSELEKKGLLPK